MATLDKQGEEIVNLFSEDLLKYFPIESICEVATVSKKLQERIKCYENLWKYKLLMEYGVSWDDIPVSPKSFFTFFKDIWIILEYGRKLRSREQYIDWTWCASVIHNIKVGNKTFFNYYPDDHTLSRFITEAFNTYTMVPGAMNVLLLYVIFYLDEVLKKNNKKELYRLCESLLTISNFQSDELYLWVARKILNYLYVNVKMPDSFSEPEWYNPTTNEEGSICPIVKKQRALIELMELILKESMLHPYRYRAHKLPSYYRLFDESFKKMKKPHSSIPYPLFMYVIEYYSQLSYSLYLQGDSSYVMYENTYQLMKDYGVSVPFINHQDKNLSKKFITNAWSYNLLVDMMYGIPGKNDFILCEYGKKRIDLISKHLLSLKENIKMKIKKNLDRNSNKEEATKKQELIISKKFIEHDILLTIEKIWMYIATSDDPFNLCNTPLLMRNIRTEVNHLKNLLLQTTTRMSHKNNIRIYGSYRLFCAFVDRLDDNEVGVCDIIHKYCKESIEAFEEMKKLYFYYLFLCDYTLWKKQKKTNIDKEYYIRGNEVFDTFREILLTIDDSSEDSLKMNIRCSSPEIVAYMEDEHIRRIFLRRFFYPKQGEDYSEELKFLDEQYVRSIDE